jgi:hypothetical protein
VSDVLRHPEPFVFVLGYVCGVCFGSRLHWRTRADIGNLTQQIYFGVSVLMFAETIFNMVYMCYAFMIRIKITTFVRLTMY